MSKGRGKVDSVSDQSATRLFFEQVQLKRGHEMLCFEISRNAEKLVTAGLSEAPNCRAWMGSPPEGLSGELALPNV